MKNNSLSIIHYQLSISPHFPVGNWPHFMELARSLSWIPTCSSRSPIGSGQSGDDGVMGLRIVATCHRHRWQRPDWEALSFWKAHSFVPAHRRRRHPTICYAKSPIQQPDRPRSVQRPAPTHHPPDGRRRWQSPSQPLQHLLRHGRPSRNRQHLRRSAIARSVIRLHHRRQAKGNHRPQFTDGIWTAQR